MKFIPTESTSRNSKAIYCNRYCDFYCVFLIVVRVYTVLNTDYFILLRAEAEAMISGSMTQQHHGRAIEDYVNRSIRAVTDLDDKESRTKKFLMRLTGSLHNAGNLSYKTEEFVEKLSRKYDLFGTCIIFPVSAMLSFTTMSREHPLANESYTFRIKSGWDCSKLDSLHQLCFDILKKDIDLFAAEKELDRIDSAEPL